MSHLERDGVRRILVGVNRRVVLAYPPVSSPWHLPAGIAQLAGVLKGDGHEVVQRYQHIGGLEFLLKSHGGKEVEDALRTIRNPESSILDLYNARLILEKVSKGIPLGGTKFAVARNNVSYVDMYYDGTLAKTLEAFPHREDNPWYDYFMQVEVPFAQDFNPEIYGMSINDERQLLPGLILASLIRENLPDCLVVVGGNLWTRLGHVFLLDGAAEFFEHCDAIVYTEGYGPLRNLIDTLLHSATAGVAWRDGERIVLNPSPEIPFDFGSMPTPVFNPEVKQWCPDFVATLYNQSNCGTHCSFCAISAGSATYLSKPRVVGAESIAQHMMEIGATRFDIFDETFLVRDQIALGEELRRIGYNATWQCYLTATNQLLDPAICTQLYAAGCRAVQLGLETLSPQTLRQENKSWNTPASYAQILGNLKNAGIQVHIFIIIGIPGEPLHWGLKWLAFLEDNATSILTIKSSRYRLTRGSPEEMNGTHSDLIEVLPDTKPLHLNRDFRYRSELISNKRLDAIRDILEEACRRHPMYQVTSTLPWWENRGRFTYEDMAQMASELRVSEDVRPEPEVDNLRRALVKASAIVQAELGYNVTFSSWDDLVAFARTL